MDTRTWRTIGLTVVSVLGVAGTAIVSHFDTKNAIDRMAKDDFYPKTWKEELKYTWKCYGRTAATVGLTTAAVILNPCLSSKDLKKVLAASGAAAGLLGEYKNAIKDEFGKEGYERVVKAVNDKKFEDYEKAEVPDISAAGLLSNESNPVIEGEDIFYDEFTHRAFISSPFAVLNGIHNYVRNLVIDGMSFRPLSELYDFWGLSSESWYKEVGYGTRMAEDGIYFIDIRIHEDGFDLAGHQKWIISYDWTPGTKEEMEEYDV